MKKLGIATSPSLVSSGLSGGLVNRTSSRLRGLAMYCALGLALHAGTAVAQEVNIPSYCADMAKAQYPVYDNRAIEFERRCGATLEVQRKHQREAQHAKALREREFNSLNAKTQQILAVIEQVNRVTAATGPDIRDREIQKLKTLLAACPRYFTQEECAEDRIDIQERIEKKLKTRIDLQGLELPLGAAQNRDPTKSGRQLPTTPEKISLKCGVAIATLEFQKNKEAAFGTEAIITVSRDQESITYYTDEEFVGMDCRTNPAGKSFVVFQTYCGRTNCQDLENFGIVDTNSVRLLLAPTNSNRLEAKTFLGTLPGKVSDVYSLSKMGQAFPK